MRKDVPACEWVAARVLNEGGGEGCGRVVADYGQYCELGEKNAKMRRCGNVIRLMRYGVSGGSESALGDGDMAATGGGCARRLLCVVEEMESNIFF